MMDADFITKTVRRLYHDDIVELHKPCIHDVTVSNSPESVERFEWKIKEATGANYAVSTISGTSALHLALLVAGVKAGDKVLTSPLTFVATCNAIRYCGADPVFVDIEWQTMGMSPDKLEEAIGQRRYAACVPVHAFGHSPRMDRIADICRSHGVPVVEDSCQAIGSRYRGTHAGLWGLCGAFSFNWNKTATAGGGGAVITNDKAAADRVRHLANVAKESSPAMSHDEVGFNYRLSALNASLGCDQMDRLEWILYNKRVTAELYAESIRGMFHEPNGAHSNYWLNTLILDRPEEVPELLEVLCRDKIQARPAWKLMHKLTMYAGCQRGDLSCAEDVAPRIINLPSGVR